MNYDSVFLLVKILIMVIIVMGVILTFTWMEVIKAKKNGEFYKRLLDHSKDAIYYYQTYPEVKFLYMSSSCNDIFGTHPSDVYKDCNFIFDSVHPDDYVNLYNKTIGKVDYRKPQFTRWLNIKGEYVCTEDNAKPIYDKSGRLIGIEGSVRDITERKKVEEELEYRSSHDMMTGLYNRNYFNKYFDRLDKEMDCKVALIVCDLNGLKLLNDNFGHAYGDKLIKESTKLLNRYSSENIVVARIGGDEFSIILTEVDESCVCAIIKNVKEDIREFNKNSQEITINMSIGYFISETSLNRMDHLFYMADKRMYQSKKSLKYASV